MAIKYEFIKRHGGVTLKSGDICKMAYHGYHEDPRPLIIFLYATSGYHPNTKHEHHYIQGINLNYISRAFRKTFVKDWLESFDRRNRNTKLTYNDMKLKYSFMDGVTRRYLYKPTYYLKKLELVTPDRIEEEVVGSLIRDYSKALHRSLFSAYRRAQIRLS
jgi:hypothetical protein